MTLTNFQKYLSNHQLNVISAIKKDDSKDIQKGNSKDISRKTFQKIVIKACLVGSFLKFLECINRVTALDYVAKPQICA